MMKPKEVRLGNLVQYEGKIFKIDSITKNFPTINTVQYEMCIVRWDDIEPVILTEEIIKQLGFDDEEYKDGFIGIDVGNTDFTLTKPNVESESMTEKYYTFHCKYGGWPRFKTFKFVHDLQNFFYAIWGEELEYNGKTGDEL